jgi:hypothetical protein
MKMVSTDLIDVRGINTGTQIIQMSLRRQILYRGHDGQFKVLKFIRRNTNISPNTLTHGINQIRFDKIRL